MSASRVIILACLLVQLFLGCNVGVLADAQRTKSFLESNPNHDTDSESYDDSDRRVLDMFGFKKRPKPGKDVHIPRLMQHLYKSHMGHEFDGQENLLDAWEMGLHLPSDDVIDRVNTARSFHHIGKYFKYII